MEKHILDIANAIVGGFIGTGLCIAIFVKWIGRPDNGDDSTDRSDESS